MQSKPFTIRALTLWPEWVWAIHHLGKRVENRTWGLPVNEWFALHAGKHIGGRPGRVAKSEGMRALWSMAVRAGTNPVVCVADIEAESSCIRGLFRVIRNEAPGHGDLTGWRVPEQVGNVFEYRPLTTPIPCSGAQGLWTVGDEVAKAIIDQVPGLGREQVSTSINRRAAR